MVKQITIPADQVHHGHQQSPQPPHRTTLLPRLSQHRCGELSGLEVRGWFKCLGDL